VTTRIASPQSVSRRDRSRHGTRVNVAAISVRVTCLNTAYTARFYFGRTPERDRCPRAFVTRTRFEPVRPVCSRRAFNKHTKPDGTGKNRRSKRDGRLPITSRLGARYPRNPAPSRLPEFGFWKPGAVRDNDETVEIRQHNGTWQFVPRWREFMCWKRVGLINTNINNNTTNVYCSW